MAAALAHGCDEFTHGNQCDRSVKAMAAPRSDPGAPVRSVSNNGVTANRSSASTVSDPRATPARMSRNVVSAALCSRAATSGAASGPSVR